MLELRSGGYDPVRRGVTTDRGVAYRIRTAPTRVSRPSNSTFSGHVAPQCWNIILILCSFSPFLTVVQCQAPFDWTHFDSHPHPISLMLQLQTKCSGVLWTIIWTVQWCKESPNISAAPQRFAFFLRPGHHRERYSTASTAPISSYLKIPQVKASARFLLGNFNPMLPPFPSNTLLFFIFLGTFCGKFDRSQLSK